MWFVGLPLPQQASLLCNFVEEMRGMQKQNSKSCFLQPKNQLKNGIPKKTVALLSGDGEWLLFVAQVQIYENDAKVLLDTDVICYLQFTFGINC